MKIAIGCDHSALDLKNLLAKYLIEKGHEIVDCGTYTYESCDYTDYGLAVAQKIEKNEEAELEEVEENDLAQENTDDIATKIEDEEEIKSKRVIVILIAIFCVIVLFMFIITQIENSYER